MSWTCMRCGLPDNYHGDGDGIGSCDCSRCDCCSAAPQECDCGRDFDDMYDDPSEPYDPLCNDTNCDHRALRLAQKGSYDRSWGY